MSNNYSWAVNRAKLNTAITHVTEKAKIDASIKADEAAIKAEYVKLLGLVREDAVSDEADDAENAPKATAKKAK